MGGLDTAQFRKPLGSYELKWVGDALRVTALKGKEGADTLLNVEQLNFGRKFYTIGELGPLARNDRVSGINGTQSSLTSWPTIFPGTTVRLSSRSAAVAWLNSVMWSRGPSTEFGVLKLVLGADNQLVLDAGSALDALTAGETLKVKFKYVVKDGSGKTDKAKVKVKIAGNDPPANPVDQNASDNSVAEGAANGTSVGITAFASDDDTVTYSLTNDAGGRFAINPTTGVVTVANGTLIDFESAPGHAYEIAVAASDGTLTSSQTFIIGVSDVAPSTPVDSDGSTGGVVPEGAANGTAVGITTFAADPGGPPASYALTNDAGGRFAIDPSTGVVTVANAALLDFESSGGSHSYTITAQATAGASSSATQDFIIAVGNVVPTTPADDDGAANSVVEGAAVDTAVGVTASSTDINGPAASYALVGDTSGGGFKIEFSDRRCLGRRPDEDRLRIERRGAQLRHHGAGLRRRGRYQHASLHDRRGERPADAAFRCGRAARRHHSRRRNHRGAGRDHGRFDGCQWRSHLPVLRHRSEPAGDQPGGRRRPLSDQFGDRRDQRQRVRRRQHRLRNRTRTCLQRHRRGVRRR